MLAFIGRSGIYSIDDISGVEEVIVETPFGSQNDLAREYGYV